MTTLWNLPFEVASFPPPVTSLSTHPSSYCCAPLANVSVDEAVKAVTVTQLIGLSLDTVGEL